MQGAVTDPRSSAGVGCMPMFPGQAAVGNPGVVRVRRFSGRADRRDFGFHPCPERKEKIGVSRRVFLILIIQG